MTRFQICLSAGTAVALLTMSGCVSTSTGWCCPIAKKAGQPQPEAEVVRAAATGVVRNTPPIMGEQLALKPDESATQRALELAQKLSSAEEEKKTLTARLHKLENDLDASRNSEAQIAREVQTAAEEVKRARAELQQYRPQMAAMQEKLKSAEKENLTTLRAIVSSLEDMQPAAKPADEAPPLPARGTAKHSNPEKN